MRTDEADQNASVYKKMTTFLIEIPTGLGEVRPGLNIPGKIDKMGYQGDDTTDLVLTDFRLPADALLGGDPGRGFDQMMDGVEVVVRAWQFAPAGLPLVPANWAWTTRSSG